MLSHTQLSPHTTVSETKALNESGGRLVMSESPSSWLVALRFPRLPRRPRRSSTSHGVCIGASQDKVGNAAWQVSQAHVIATLLLLVALLCARLAAAAEVQRDARGGSGLFI